MTTVGAKVRCPVIMGRRFRGDDQIL